MNAVARFLNQVFLTIAMHAPIGRFRKMFYAARGTKIGRNVFIENEVFIDSMRPELVEILDGASIAPRAMIITHSGPSKQLERFFPREEKKVVIGKNCWIGANAIILPGVEIGEGSVVGAGAVVTKDVEPFTVVAGVPAIFIRRVNEKK